LEIFVTQGQIVQQGDLLAFSGGKTPPAGNSTGPHLHEGIMHKDANGNYFWLNPENFVDPSLFVEVGC
jgi:murein DD-endopeptidase MepM/ murein hydrolase activator NlpD